MVNKILSNYINIESKRIVTHIVNKSINDLNKIQINDFLIKSKDKMSYNMNEINKYKRMLTNRLQTNFSEIEQGNYSNYPLYSNYNKKKYKNIKTGYLCEVNFNLTRKSTLFANVGPSIPIKLSYIGDTIVNIDIEEKEYGINNVIVKIFAVVEVTNQVSMPISSKKTILKVKVPISINIINGQIPNYYSYR